MNKALDNLFERATKIIGSTIVIAASIIWCAYAFIKGNRDFLDVVSMVTFIFGEFILRGQNVQAERQEKYVKRAARDTKKDLELSKQVLDEVEDLRYQK